MVNDCFFGIYFELVWNVDSLVLSIAKEMYMSSCIYWRNL